MCGNELDLDYAKECWSIANNVTVFAVIQMITYLISAGSNNSTIRDGIIRIRAWVLGAILVATVLYSFLVWLLTYYQLDLLQSSVDKKLTSLFLCLEIARLVAIWLSGITGFCLTFTIREES